VSGRLDTGEERQCSQAAEERYRNALTRRRTGCLLCVDAERLNAQLTAAITESSRDAYCPCFDAAPDLCDDGDACTTDFCDAAAGCVHLSCDDGNVCTDDRCVAGTGCVHRSIPVACEDGDQCTQGDRCSAGRCVSGARLSCDDGNVCTEDTCSRTTGCVHTPRGSAVCP
jgi:hypothetical protein